MENTAGTFSHNDFSLDSITNVTDDACQVFSDETSKLFRQMNLCGGENVPSPRAAHTATAVGNCIFYFGGWSGNVALGDAFAYHTSLKKWARVLLHEDEIIQKASKKKSKNLLARNNHAAALVESAKPPLKSQVYIHGGHDGGGWLSDMICVDVSNIEHQIRTTPSNEHIVLNVQVVEQLGKVPTKRACHSLTNANGLLYAFGGYDGSACYNNLDVFTPSSNNWSRLSKPHGKKPAGRNAHVMLVDSAQENLYLFGGHSGKSYYRDVHQYCIAKHTWTYVDVTGDLPPSTRGSTGALLRNKFYIFGGFDGNARYSDLYSFNPDTSVWTFISQPTKMITDRQRHSMVCVNNTLYVFGGYDGVKWMSDLYGITCHRQSSIYATNKSINMFLNNLALLIGSPLFSDVTISADGKEIPAHKNILAASSRYFYNLFTSEDCPTVVQLHGWSYQSSLYLMEYLYTGRISEFNCLSYASLCEVMGLADSIQLYSLKNLCQDELQEKIDCENVCYLLKSSCIYKASNLKNASFSFISEHSDQVIHTSAFEELSSVPSLVIELTKFMNKR